MLRYRDIVSTPFGCGRVDAVLENDTVAVAVDDDHGRCETFTFKASECKRIAPSTPQADTVRPPEYAPIKPAKRKKAVFRSYYDTPDSEIEVSGETMRDIRMRSLQNPHNITDPSDLDTEFMVRAIIESGAELRKEEKVEIDHIRYWSLRHFPEVIKRIVSATYIRMFGLPDKGGSEYDDRAC